MDSPELQYLKTMTEASIKLATFFAKSLIDVQARLMSIASTQRTNVLVQMALDPQEFDQRQKEQLDAYRTIAQSEILALLKTLDLPAALAVDLESDSVQ